jgi:hypothetical protein
MELISVLGQYLLLSFVLPGFCYVAVVGAWLTNAEFQRLKGYWLGASVVGGLLVSSIAFAIEILARYFSVQFDCEWFPRIPFDKLHDMGSVVNFFAGETFMHLNIAFGMLVIFVVFVIDVTAKRHWGQRHGIFQIQAKYFALALVVLTASNLIVSAYLFHRVNDVAYNVRDAVDQDKGEGSAKYCTCLRKPRDSKDPQCKEYVSALVARILAL